MVFIDGRLVPVARFPDQHWKFEYLPKIRRRGLAPMQFALVDKATWTARYDRIRDFETELFESGTRILKFFLHISKAEQLARFEQRLDDPGRNWKISESDYSERELWDSAGTGLQAAG